MTTTTAQIPFEVFIECEPDDVGPNYTLGPKWRAAGAEAHKRFGRMLLPNEMWS